MPPQINVTWQLFSTTLLGRIVFSGLPRNTRKSSVAEVHQPGLRFTWNKYCMCWFCCTLIWWEINLGQRSPLLCLFGSEGNIELQGPCCLPGWAGTASKSKRHGACRWMWSHRKWFPGCMNISILIWLRSALLKKTSKLSPLTALWLTKWPSGFGT